MNSIELIQKITNGEIDNCKVIYSRIYDKGTIEVKDKELRWEPGTFTTKFLTDGFTEFEILDGNIENIQKIQNAKDLGIKVDRIIDDLITSEDIVLSDLRAEREKINGKQEGYREAMFNARTVIINYLKEDKQRNAM